MAPELAARAAKFHQANKSAGKFRFKVTYTEQLSSPDIADALPNKHFRYKGGTWVIAFSRTPENASKLQQVAV